jgi:hypothetical protein
MTVDVHQHLWPEAFVAALQRRRDIPRLRGTTLVLAEGEYEIEPADHDLATRIAVLDRDGTDVAVVSLQPTLGIEELEPGEQDELHALWEEGTLELVQASGGRLVALAPGRVTPGFAGTVVPAAALRDVDAFASLLDDLAAKGGFLFVHPSAAPGTPGAPEWWPAVLDYTHQMQAAYLTWLSYAQRTWPAVKVVFAILAGGGPFQLERLASRGVAVRSGLHDNLFFDVASYGRRAIELCIETYGVHQLVYGTDRPVVDPSPTRRAVDGFGASVVQLLTTDNPTRLLP